MEHHPVGYAWRERFPEAQRVAAFEGGAVYGAHAEGGYWLIRDEGTLADLLDLERDKELLSRLITLEPFEDHNKWERAVEALRKRRVGGDER